MYVAVWRYKNTCIWKVKWSTWHEHGTTKNLTPWQKFNPWPPKHRAGALLGNNKLVELENLFCTRIIDQKRGNKQWWQIYILLPVTPHRYVQKCRLITCRKSPDSELRGGNSWWNCIRHLFFLLLPAVKKECLIMGYYIYWLKLTSYRCCLVLL